MQPANVLVVEDDLALAYNMALMLDPLDVHTEVAGTAGEALALAAARPFDVALLDICLPDGDGVTLLPELQARCPGAEVVFITGRASVESAAAAVRAGAADYVLKPFTSERLLGSVRAALARKAEARAELGAQLRDGRIAAVGTLATGLAHELRNPLNSALLQLTLAQRRVRGGMRGRGASEVAACLDAVGDELRRLARILGDFEACLTPGPLARRDVSVDELFRAVVEDVRAAAEASGVRVRSELPPSPPTLHVDPDRLRRALHHLTRNAVEAMPDGGTLTLRARGAEGAVEVDVADTGPGVPDERAIFDPFFTTKPSGTGLGLTIAHRTVMDHGGTIRVVSSPGGGTCFTLALPAQPPAQ